jgi:hypothetical protein
MITHFDIVYYAVHTSFHMYLHTILCNVPLVMLQTARTRIWAFFIMTHISISLSLLSVTMYMYVQFNLFGSPYVLRVSAQSDATKVKISGRGIEHGVLSTFQSRFTVDTRGAGACKLTVQVQGPNCKSRYTVH